MLAKAALWQAPVLVTFSAGPNAALLTLPDVSIFIADTDYELLAVSEIHEVLGTDGSAVAMDVKKVTGTDVAASGTTMLASTFNLKATVATVVTKSLSNAGLTGGATPTAAQKAARRIAAGNRIALDFSGTMTAVAGVCVTLWLKRLRRPSY